MLYAPVFILSTELPLYDIYNRQICNKKKRLYNSPIVFFLLVVFVIRPLHFTVRPPNHKNEAPLVSGLQCHRVMSYAVLDKLMVVSCLPLPRCTLPDLTLTLTLTHSLTHSHTHTHTHTHHTHTHSHTLTGAIIICFYIESNQSINQSITHSLNHSITQSLNHGKWYIISATC